MTAGHVDHGKSTLVRALTGMEPDRLEEERRRGLTIELGYAWTDLADAGGGRVAFVDVPGHERLVRTMLAGAGTAPAVLFVVAADDGWSAQSSEHRDVLDLLDVPAVAVAVTKCDTVPEARVQEVVDDLAARLADTALAGAPVVCTDARSGRGLGDLRRVLAAGVAALPAPASGGRPRLWVDRSFAPTGVGTVVTGTLTGGALTTGDELTLLPADRRVRARGLQALGAPVETAVAGMRVALDLAGVAHTEVQRGDALVAAGPWRTTTLVDVWVRALPGHRIDRAGAWTLHAGTAAVGCRVLPLDGAVEGPSSGAVRLLLQAELPLVAGDRVVLREAGRRATVGGGVVADPLPGRRPRGTRARTELVQALQTVVAAATAERRLVALLEVPGAAHRPVGDALAAVGAPADAPLPAGVVRVGDRLVAKGRAEDWARGLTASLGPGTHERATVVATAVRAGAPTEVAEALVEALTRGGRLVRAGGGLALAEHASAASAAVSGRAGALLADLAADPFAPEHLDVLAARYGVDHRLLTALVNRGEIVRTGDVAFARTAVRRGVARLATLEDEVGPFTAAQAKTAWATTRRYAIPLLEHLDAAGITVFDGRLRQLTAKGRALAAEDVAGTTADD
ncbi:selenocysteine-specific translation elongation factor [Egicoccus sp. AB-alg2]|uniref:selenocysteine-specific translation elongation factor n=1 Tax=Egicoccus sp. AB-alg2 TaxID=3242693 RepID=UPI00359E6617